MNAVRYEGYRWSLEDQQLRYTAFLFCSMLQLVYTRNELI